MTLRNLTRMKDEQLLQRLTKLHEPGDRTGAIEFGRKILSSVQDNRLIHEIIAANLMLSNRLIEALDHLNSVALASPAAPGARNNLGLVRKKLGEIEEAARQFKMAILLEPINASALINLVILSRTSNFALSKQWWRRSFCAVPQAPELHYNLGRIFESTNYGLSIDRFRSVEILRPYFKGGYERLGRGHFIEGRDQEARAMLQRAALFPDVSSESHMLLFALSLNGRSLSEAITHIRQAVQNEPKNPAYSFFLAAALDHAGDTSESQKTFSDLQGFADHQIDSWNYIKSNRTDKTKILGTAHEMFRFSVSEARKPGLVLEFGVRFGTSIRQIANLADQHVHGFDSFIGLPEAWGDRPAGTFTTGGIIPSVPDNVTLHKGWFEETLPKFAAENRAPIRLMNVDCDIYSSTVTILNNFRKNIAKGTVIIFDEYIGNPEWREDEFKALQEFSKSYNIKYEYIAFNIITNQTAILIL